MEETSLYRPTRAQLALRELVEQKSKILAYGGSRSGKTFEFCHALADFGVRFGGRYAVFRRYFNSVRYSVFDDTFPKMLELAFPGLEYKRSLSDTKILLPETGAEFWFVGLDNERRVEKILGREYAAIYFNECSEIAYSAVEIATTRLAQRLVDAKGRVMRNRAFFDCNPPGKSHWTYRLFLEGINPTTRARVNDPQEYGVIQINPADNAENLPAQYIESTLAAGSEKMKKRFLYGEFSNDTENALWKQETIDARRILEPPRDLERIVVGVDPAVTSNDSSDNTGIVVAGRSLALDGRPFFYVLDDRSLCAPPERWAREVVEAFRFWQGDAVVVETNQGGALVASALRQIDPNLPIRTVRATRGKILRAEPISILYEHGRVSHVGVMRELEEEMTCYAGPSTPDQTVDRLDALVWAMTELANYSGDCVGGFFGI